MTDWIEWNGGECPLKDGVKHYRQYRDQTRDEALTVYHRSGAKNYVWEHRGNEDDIIAYKVINNDTHGS